MVFGEGKIETGEGDKKKTIFFPKWDPKTDTTAEKIIKKLSDQTKLETPVVEPARLNVLAT